MIYVIFIKNSKIIFVSKLARAEFKSTTLKGVASQEDILIKNCYVDLREVGKKAGTHILIYNRK